MWDLQIAPLLGSNSLWKKTGIPGEIHQEQSKDFAHNRTLSVQAALKTLRDFAFSLPHTYLLVLEPDMTLHPTAAFKKAT